MSEDRSKSLLEDPKLTPQVLGKMRSEHAARIADAMATTRLFYDRPIIGGSTDKPLRSLSVFEKMRAAYGNLSYEIITAAQAQVCRQLQARVLPVGGDWDLQLSCEQGSQLIDGVNDNADFLELGQRAFRDGCSSDLGPMRGYLYPNAEEPTEIRWKRGNPFRLYWPLDGSPTPRTLVYDECMARDVAAARWPKHRKAIEGAPEWRPLPVPGVEPTRSSRPDTIEVIEVEITQVGTEKGQQWVCLADGTMLEEPSEYEYEDHTWIRYIWDTEWEDYAGLSLGRIVAPYDLGNKRLLKEVWNNLRGAVPWVVKNEEDTAPASDVPFQTVIQRGPAAPAVYLPAVVHPQILEQLQRNRETAYQLAGINQNLATGAAPARFTSGAAQQEFVDIAQSRLQTAHKTWERLWRDAARVTMMLGAHLKGGVSYRDGDRYQVVKMPRLPRDKYRVTFAVSSGIPLTTSGKLEKIEMLRQGQAIDTPEYVALVMNPDVKAAVDRITGPRDNVASLVNQALKNLKEPVRMPSGFVDFNLLLKVGGDAYQQNEARGTAPPEAMERLRRLMLMAKARLAGPQNQNATAMPEAGPGGAPPGAGGPPGGPPVEGMGLPAQAPQGQPLPMPGAA